jgi:cobalamin biosynthesis protein CobD/CbiB
MAGITYFVALPFDVADTSIIVGEPIEYLDPAAAIGRAHDLRTRLSTRFSHIRSVRMTAGLRMRLVVGSMVAVSLMSLSSKGVGTVPIIAENTEALRQ